MGTIACRVPERPKQCGWNVGYVALAGRERRLAEKVSDDWTREPESKHRFLRRWKPKWKREYLLIWGKDLDHAQGRARAEDDMSLTGTNTTNLFFLQYETIRHWPSITRLTLLSHLSFFYGIP
jgi:hypothetical protein